MEKVFTKMIEQLDEEIIELEYAVKLAENQNEKLKLEILKKELFLKKLEMMESSN